MRLATDDDDLRASERLRYNVFVDELGGDGPLVDHAGRFERDSFDSFYDHLILVDDTRDRSALDHVVGVYRLLPGDRSDHFYSESEYDLTLLKQSGRRLLELGRSCVHRDYRGGLALQQLWAGLAGYVLERDIEILFGVASMHGTDVETLAHSLSHLNHAHLAPPDLRVRAQEDVYQPMDLVPVDQIDRVAAMRQVPALIKSYLRIGGFVGDGAFIDHEFNTTDVCMILDIARLNAATRARFEASKR